MVQTLKTKLKRMTDIPWDVKLPRILLALRSTPCTSTKRSPSELLMNRQLRTLLDTMHPNMNNYRKAENQILENANKKHRETEVGKKIMYRNYAEGGKWKPGMVIGKEGPSSYRIETEEGDHMRRHIDQLIKIKEKEIEGEIETETDKELQELESVSEFNNEIVNEDPKLDTSQEDEIIEIPNKFQVYNNTNFNFNYEEDNTEDTAENDVEDDADNTPENDADDNGHDTAEDDVADEGDDTAEDDVEDNTADNTENDIDVPEYHTPHIQPSNNKIILGSKPTLKVSLNSEVRIHLEDWKERLRTSKCYCRDCKTLFATRNGIDAHRMATHSFLVPLDDEIRTNTARKSTTQGVFNKFKSIAKKSTTKNAFTLFNRKSSLPIFNESINRTARKSTTSILNTARKSTGTVSMNPSTSDVIKNINVNGITDTKFCNHCNKHFSDNTQLIKHLYELLTANSVESSSVQSDITSTQDNLCYKCSLCSCIYRTFIKYQKHMKINHNQIETMCEPKPYTPQCAHCQQELCRISSYNQHIKFFHSKLFTKVINKSILCTICNDVFDTYGEARRHRAIQHSGMVGKSLFRNIDTNDIKRNPKVEKIPDKNVSSDDEYKFPIPKSVLFKCGKCQNHFLNCASAIGHTQWCRQGKLGSIETCYKCKRMFKSADIQAHYKQHNVSDKLKIYIIHDYMHSRVVCKCPNCDLCFDERKFHQHTRNGCKKTKSVRCTYCNLNFHGTSIELHKKIHSIRKFIRDDFILVEFIDKNNLDLTKSLKRKMTTMDDEAPKPKLRKTYKPNVLLFCDMCKGYMKPFTHYRKLHLEGGCRKLMKSRCDHCGLSFTSPKSLKKHLAEHETTNIELSTFTFLRLRDEKPMTPPVPDFPYCKRCKALTSTSKHNCLREKITKCNVCKKTFQQSTYKIHLAYHSYKMEVPNDTDEIPKLMEKYESLTTTWNILYTCDSCDTTTDCYDRVIEHSQNHFSNLEHYGVTIKNCDVCGFNFDEPSYLKHLEFHNNYKNIKRNSFMVLTYSYTNLFSNKWKELFENVSTMQTRQILFKSIYVALDVKMKLLADGFPDLTIYKCKKCNLFVDPKIVSQHVHNKCCDGSVQYECSVCYIPFTTSLGCKNHEKLHQVWNEEKSFRVVGFNEVQDESFNRNLRMHRDSLGDDVAVKSADPDEDIDDNNSNLSKKIANVKKKYKIYKCVKCTVSLLGNKKLVHHVCDKSIRQCHICKHNYPTSRFAKHLNQHSRHPKLTENNIITHLFDPDNGYRSVDLKIEEDDDIGVQNNVDSVFEVHQCRCGLNFTSEQTLGLHIDVCSRNLAISKEKCSKCGLLFPTQSLVTHLCKHHSKGDSTIVVKQFLTFYKCGVCMLHFSNMAILTKHKKACSKSYSEKCSVCHLNFHSLAIGIHKAKHRRVKNLEKRPIEIVTIGKNGDVTNTEIIDLDAHKLTKNVSIYKCGRCHVHYLTEKSLRYHMEMKHVVVHGLSTCVVCGLRFTNHSINRHMNSHHTLLRCRLKDFNIISRSQLSELGSEKQLNNSREQIQDNNSSIDVSDTDDKLAVQEFNVLVDGKGFEVNPIKSKPKKKNETSVDSETSNIDNDDTNDSESNISNVTQEQDVRVKNDTSLKKWTKTCYSLSDQFLSKLDVAKYSNKLYKCGICPLYFLNSTTLENHIRNSSHTYLVADCETCGLQFSHYTLPRHEYIHHKKLGLKLDDFIILDNTNREPVTATDSKKDTVQPEENHDTTDDNSLKEIVVSQSNTAESVAQDNSVLSNEAETASTRKNVIELFKCADCNVFFLNRNSITKHTSNHEPLPAMEYIECKMCNFQFKIVSLMSHITKHHKDDFKLENVLIEEYKQDPNSDTPKIDIYYAVERDQSRLVSTTAEINDSMAEKNNDLTQAELDTTDKAISSEKNDSPKQITESSNTDQDAALKSDVDNKIASSNVHVTDESINTNIENNDNQNALTQLNEVNDKELTSEDTNKNIENDSRTEAGDTGDVDLENAVVKTENDITCNFCTETFKSQRAKEFHESLDHLDQPQNCRICSKSMNMSILKELHLSIKNNTFTCCICNQLFHVNSMTEHITEHNMSDKDT
ncbi:uncharacterized protein ACR2FA_010849 [Aphomia sociella]